MVPAQGTSPVVGARAVVAGWAHPIMSACIAAIATIGASGRGGLSPRGRKHGSGMARSNVGWGMVPSGRRYVAFYDYDGGLRCGAGAPHQRPRAVAIAGATTPRIGGYPGRSRRRA